MIIDAHCHAGRGDGLTGPWDTAAPLGRYLARAALAGITQSVIFPLFHSDYRAANRQIGRLVAGCRGRLLGAAFVHAERDRGRVAEMVREAIATYGCCAIKVHKRDARISREVCEVAARFSLPVLYDVVGEASIIELLAREYPRVTFVIPHLGSFADDWRAQLAVVDHAARHPNVYADSSGVRRFDFLQQAVRRAGARKLIFGTDGPWLHPAVELAKIRALRLPPADERLVLAGNFLRITRRARRNATSLDAGLKSTSEESSGVTPRWQRFTSALPR